MIYSEDYWKSEGEGKKMVPISTGLSWVRMEPLLRNAQADYILPLLGEEQTSELDAIYEMRPADRSKAEENALAVAQKAVVNLALWSNFDALSVRISDQGFQRQESDSWRPAYKYQEDMLRRTFANAGFNALDQLLVMMEEDPESWPLFPSSPAYTLASKSVVKNTAEVQEVYDIHSSRLLFLRLQPIMRQKEELALQPILGDKAYSGLRAWLDDGTQTCGGHVYDIATWESLRDRCRKVVVMEAVLQLLRTTGTVTDRGAYFTVVTSSGGGNESAQPASDTRLQLMISDAEHARDGYVARLTSWFASVMTELSGGDPLRVLDRDNDGHSAFFA